MKERENSLIVQGSILALAGILTKIIGFIYRIPMANMLGEQGNGIYSVSFGIYNVALTLSSYSLPLALSKLISSRLAKNEIKNAYCLFKRALIFAVIAGACAFAVLFFGADWLEAVYARTGLAYPLKVLAPTAFIVSLLGVFRGYFQGHSNMVPTALSQVFEQVINAIVSIFATYLFMKAFLSDPNVSARGAAGATLGTLAGAFGALVMLTLFFVSRLSQIKQNIKLGTDTIDSNRLAYFDIITTMFPIILSQSIYQIGFTADDLIFGNVMADKGMADSVVSSLQGVFNTQFTQLINLPIAIATSLAASTLPSISRLSVQGKHEEKTHKIRSVIKLTMAIAIPSAIGLAFFARPITTALFPSLISYRDVATRLLTYGSSACVFYSLATITTSVLQGNDKMKVPVINSVISLLFHILLIYPLLKFTDLSVYALIIGDISFPLVIAVLNYLCLKKHVHQTINIKSTFILPLLISLIMGVISRLIYDFMSSIGVPNIPSLCVSLALAVFIYAFLVLLFGVFYDNELTELPAGAKILKIKKKVFKK